MRRFANELELYISASGHENAMHRTDLTGLAVVMDASLEGRDVTPGDLSKALQLSAPATSAMLDRLERHGHVVRRPSLADRRSVLVEMTETAWRVGGEMFGRLGEHMAPVLADYSDSQLQLIAEFLERAGDAASAARASRG